MQVPPPGMHIGVVVDVEVVLVEVEVVLLVVLVVVCVWQVPLEQFPLQHCWFFLHFPLGLHRLSAAASPT